MTVREFLVIMAAIWIITVFVILAISHLTHGQDIDPNYYCLYENQYPYKELCNEQRINETMADMLETAKRFNAMNDSEKCEVDESSCVLGVPDPDFEDDGMEEYGFCEGNLTALDREFCDQR